MTATDTRLPNKRIAILATNGVEHTEIMRPRRALEGAGATTVLVSPNAGKIRSWDHDHWGHDLTVDMALSEADAEDFDALVIPGGVMSPDTLRTIPKAVSFVRAFATAGKPIAAICHGPWLLIEAGLAHGRTLTSWPSLKTDLLNAGADWVDREVVIDEGVVTSRKPDDIPVFCARVIETFAQRTAQDLTETPRSAARELSLH